MSSPLILPNSGRAYDPNVAQDHTGAQFVTRAAAGRQRDPKFDPNLFIKKPKWYTCGACNRDDRFRILTETDPMGDGCSQIECKCGAKTPVLQFSQPQVNEAIARKLGLRISDNIPAFDIDIELAKGE